jgi:putative transposase
MPRPRKVRPKWDELATIWQVSDDLWVVVAPILAELDPPKPKGRPHVDARATLNAIIFWLRSNCQWNQLPERFPDDSSVDPAFQRWVRLGVFARISSALVAACAELGEVDWEWQAADGAMGKARLGDLVGRNPTDRGKPGVKRSALVETGGGPLAMVIAGTNVHDTKLLATTLEAVVVEHPQPTSTQPQHLCLDVGYDNPTGQAAVAAHGYLPHLRRIGAEKLDPVTGEPRYPARRWVVERTPAWLSKCRAFLVRYDNHAATFLGLFQFACALLWFRRLQRLSPMRVI